MRNVIIAGNWKMNKTFSEVEDFLDDFVDALEGIDHAPVEVVICPPALYLELTSDYAQDSSFAVGAQDVSAHPQGAYTGEIAAEMLESMDLHYCIIGHSERRKYHHEKDSLIHEKLNRLLEQDLIPIVCVGETLQEREAGITRDVIVDQLKGVFTGVDFENPIVIAYEPVWAIGTGKTASPEQAQEIHALIRQWLSSNVSEEAAESTRILYGGSMKPENIAELISQPDIDGGLIGGASLHVDKLIAMIKTAMETE
jgi:triosephosphate isomerase